MSNFGCQELQFWLTALLKFSRFITMAFDMDLIDSIWHCENKSKTLLRIFFKIKKQGKIISVSHSCISNRCYFEPRVIKIITKQVRDLRFDWI